MILWALFSYQSKLLPLAAHEAAQARLPFALLA